MRRTESQDIKASVALILTLVFANLPFLAVQYQITDVTDVTYQITVFMALVLD